MIRPLDTEPTYPRRLQKPKQKKHRVSFLAYSIRFIYLKTFRQKICCRRSKRFQVRRVLKTNTGEPKRNIVSPYITFSRFRFRDYFPNRQKRLHAYVFKQHRLENFVPLSIQKEDIRRTKLVTQPHSSVSVFQSSRAFRL